MDLDTSKTCLSTTKGLSTSEVTMQTVSRISREDLKNYTFEVSENVVKNQSNEIEVPNMEPIVKLIYRIYCNFNIN